jgi:hypothetical protein
VHGERMFKKNIRFIILFIVFIVSCELIPIHGGGSNLVIPEYPFYFSFNPKGSACVNNVLVNITNPINGSNIFFPNITPNVTFTMSGSTSPVCQYRLNVRDTWYAWNDWSDCGNGDGLVNNKLVTLPEGFPIIIQVRVDDTCGNTFDDVSVDVYYSHAGSDTEIDWLILLPTLMIFFILFLDKEKKKKKVNNS